MPREEVIFKMIYSLKGDLNIHVVGSFTSRWSLLGEQEQDEEQNLPVYNNIFSKKQFGQSSKTLQQTWTL